MITLRPLGITRGGRRCSLLYPEWLHNGSSGTVFQAMVLRPDLWVTLSFFLFFSFANAKFYTGQTGWRQAGANSLRSTPPSLTLY